MADIAASTKLGQGFGPVYLGNCKMVCVNFATTATGDTLNFDVSTVGKENALSKIVWAVGVSATGVGSSTAFASNVVTINNMNAAAATTITVLAIGVGA